MSPDAAKLQFVQVALPLARYTKTIDTRVAGIIFLGDAMLGLFGMTSVSIRNILLLLPSIYLKWAVSVLQFFRLAEDSRYTAKLWI